MAKVFQFPFNVPEWTEHLNAKDPVALVIRAHLYIEALLIRLIEAALVRKDALNVTELQFPRKVKLAVALGKIEPKDHTADLAFNKLRNKFAHNLGTQLTEQDELDLHNSFSDTQRELAKDLRERDPQMPFMGRLRCDLVALMMQLMEEEERIGP